MEKLDLKDIYISIKNLEESLEIKDDIIAGIDFKIYKLETDSFLPTQLQEYKNINFDTKDYNLDIDFKKYFQVKYNLDTDNRDFSKNYKKLSEEINYQIENRNEIIKIRNQQLKKYSDKNKSGLDYTKESISTTSRIKKLIHLYESKGVKETFRFTKSKIKLLLKRDHNFSNSIITQNIKIAYVVNALSLSGGMQIVIRHTEELRKRGYDVSIISLAEYDPSEWVKVNVPLIWAYNQKSNKLIEDLDIIVATHWSTVPYVLTTKAKRKIYFVQSDERRFILEKKYNENLLRFIEDTYKSDMEFMTEAIWIQKWLKEEFNHDAYYVPNGLDTEVFYKTNPILPKGKKPRVLIEGQINFWLKAVEQSYEAVKDLDIDLWIISSWGTPPKHWKYDRFFEKVPFEDMKNIYSSCDIFLKMSKVEGFFGPPMEAMTCGCAVVVSKVSGYDEYIKNNENALVVESGDIKGAKEAVNRLINDINLRNKLIKNGSEVCKDWQWEKSFDLLEKVIKKEDIEIFYSSNFPEEYDFKNEQIKINLYLKKRDNYLYR